MNRLDKILLSLRSKGYRISKGRKIVIEALLMEEEPVETLKLHSKLLSQKKRIDKVTVYRELKFLADVGMVHPVHFNDNIQRYEIAPESGHQHHLVCTSCKTVKNVDMACDVLHAVEKKITNTSNFDVRGHSLEFYGLCSRCS